MWWWSSTSEEAPEEEAAVAPTLSIRANWPRLMSFERTVRAVTGVAGVWPLTEAAGSGKCFDLIGGNHATVTGPTLGTTGILAEDAGTAASFDGTDDYLTIADAAGLDTGDTFSFFAVIDRTAADAKHYIAHKGTGAWGLYVSAANALTLEEVGTADIVASTVTLDDAPHSVCVTKSGATVKLFLDGIDVTGTVTNQTLASTAAALEIGRSAAAGDHFAGAIAYPSLFNVALSATTVSRLHVAARLGQFGFSGSAIERYVESTEIDDGSNEDWTGDRIGTLTLECDDPGALTPNHNLALNPSLEWGLTDWAAVASGTVNWIADAPADCGTYCGQVTSTGSGDGASQTLTGTFRAGVPISAGIALDSVSGTTSLRLTLTDGTTTENADVTATTSWVRYGAVTLTPVADRTSITFSVKANAAGAAVFRFDALQVNLGEALHTYVDGPSKPWLSPGLPIHVSATHDATAYPLFYGEVERIDPRPEEFRTTIVAYDALKKYAVPVDLQLVRSTAFRARYGLIEAAIRRIEGGYENLILGQTATTGWTFGGSASGGSTISVASGGSGQATYNSGGTAVTWPTMKVGRYYTLQFNARYDTALEGLNVRFGVAGDYDTWGTPNSGDPNVIALPALTDTYQTFRLSYVSTAEQAPYILFTSTSNSDGVEITEVMVTEGLGAHDYIAYGAATQGRRTNWLWDADGMIDHAVVPSGNWIPGFANRISNPEAVTNTTGWSTSVDSFITNAGATVARVTAGGYYGGSELTFATALQVTPDSPTATDSGARLSPSGTFLEGKLYRFTGFITDNALSSSSLNWTVGIGSDGTPADVATATVSSNANGEWAISWTPDADRTDVKVFIRSLGAESAAIIVSGMKVIPAWGTEYTSDYLRAGFTLDQPITITSVAQGVTHPTSLSVTTAAVTGSGVARLVDLHHVSGVVYTFSCWLTASTGTPSVVVGLGDPFGLDSSPESNTTTVALSTTPQRVVLHFTGSDETLYGQVVAWVAASSASSFTFYLDDPSITLSTATQPYIPAELALDMADVDILPGRSFEAANAISELAGLNTVTLAHHAIVPQSSHPFGKYTSYSRQALTAQTSDETYSALVDDGIQDFAGFEIDRQAIRHAVIVEYDPSSVIPADGTSVTLPGIHYAEDLDSIERYGLVGGLAESTYTVDGSGWLNGPAGTDTTVPDIADLLITRFSEPRTRPVMVIENHWPEMLQRRPFDLVTVTYERAGVVGEEFLILSRTLRVTDAATRWEASYELEEAVFS